MNLSFHYYAVKTLALEAGIVEKEAQQIAKFSQYVDDNNSYYYRKYSNMPKWVVEDTSFDMYLRNPFNPMNFNPVTTGFIDLVDLSLSMLERYQKFTTSPFHFIPRSDENISQKDYTIYKAKLNDGSIISDELNLAKEKLYAGQNIQERMMAYMQIGARLHVFADTYAHASFSGFNEKCNNAVLKKVITRTLADDNYNSKTGVSELYGVKFIEKDETIVYNNNLNKILEKLQSWMLGHQPAIGHMMLGHLPDYPWIKYTYQFTDGNPQNASKVDIEKDNLQVYLEASREIYNYFRELLLEKPVIDSKWDDIASRLVKGFLFDETAYSDEKELNTKLNQHWTSVYTLQGYKYSYDPTNIFECDQKSTGEIQSDTSEALFPIKSEDYYLFHGCSNNLLTRLYGRRPRDRY